MTTSETEKDSEWQKTPYANLVRYKSSGIYFARFRVRGKLIRRALKTSQLTVAKLRLADLEKQERQRAEHQTAVADGAMAFADAMAIYKQRLAGDGSLKPRSKVYREERMAALLKSWRGLDKSDVRKISKGDCLSWAAEYGRKAAPSNFNNTVGTLRLILDIAVEAGARYDNPARFIKRLRVLPKKLQLPSQDQFLALVEAIEGNDGGYNHRCADLVRFLAFGGFRKGEAATITWADCDFERGEIIVRGDPETGTKNWSIRRVPMIPEMRAMLERLRQSRPEDSPQSHVMRVRECQGAINSACRRLGVARFTHHDLRHLFATRCIESGVDIPTVSRWLGHKDGGALAMKVYGHLRTNTPSAWRSECHSGKPRPKTLSGATLTETGDGKSEFATGSPETTIKEFVPASWFHPIGIYKVLKRIWHRLPNVSGKLFLTFTVDPKLFADEETAFQESREWLRKVFFQLRHGVEQDGRRYEIDAPYCVKVEFHESGWVHYHVILLTQNFLPKELLSELWGLGWVKVQRIKNGDFRYLLKYVTKAEQLPGWVLRRKRLRVFQTTAGFLRPLPEDANKNAPGRDSKPCERASFTLEERLRRWACMAAVRVGAVVRTVRFRVPYRQIFDRLVLSAARDGRYQGSGKIVVPRKEGLQLWLKIQNRIIMKS